MKNLKSIISIISLILACNQLGAQDLKLITDKSSIIVNGTSTVHDWEISCEKISGNAQIELIDNKLTGIEDFEFQVVVKGMKSGKGMMDNKTYNALKEKSYPSIEYKLYKVNKIETKTNESYSVMAEGLLTIAGNTKAISHKVTATISGGKVLFSGEYNLDMTAYSIAPPTAMMGAIKTGKNVVIKFETTFLIN